MKNNNISKNLEELKKIIKEVAAERQPIAQSIYDELEFLQETLIKLKEQVREHGAVTLFQNGKQEYLRENPALKAYNTSIQRYSLLYKQLIELLPPATITESDELIDFMESL